jgi:hypothetical protein
MVRMVQHSVTGTVSAISWKGNTGSVRKKVINSHEPIFSESRATDPKGQL